MPLIPAAELADIRARLDLTQAQLADLLGVTPPTISRWLSGQRRVPELALRFARTLCKKKSCV